MEMIIVGAIGGAAYALNGLFKNKYELAEKFELHPIQAISSVIVGAIIGGVIGGTGLPEPQVVILIAALGINKGVKAFFKLIYRKISEWL